MTFALAIILAAAPPPVRYDHNDIPLPPGALARIGSAKFRVAGRLTLTAFSARECLVAACAEIDDGTLHVFDERTGREIFRRAYPVGTTPTALRFAGRELYAAGRHTLEILTPAGRVRASTPLPGRATDIRPDLAEVACVDEADGFVLFDMNTRKSRPLPFPARSSDHPAARYSPDGSRLVAFAAEGRFLVWDVPSARLVGTLDFSAAGSYGTAPTFSDATTARFVADETGHAVDLLTLRVVESAPRPPPERPYLTLHPPLIGTRAVADRWGRLCVASVLTREPTDYAIAQQRTFGSVRILPDGQAEFNYVGGRRSVASLETSGEPAYGGEPFHHPSLPDEWYRLEDGRCEMKWRRFPPYRVDVRDIDSRRVLWSRPVAGDRLRAWACSDDGRVVAVADDYVRAFDALTGRERCRIPLSGDEVRLKLSPDGSLLAVARAERGEVAVYDSRTGRRTHTLTEPRPLWVPHGWGLAFSQDNKRLAVAEDDLRVIAHDLTTSRMVLLSENGRLHGPSPWSADGRLVAVREWPGSPVCLRDADTGKAVLRLPTAASGGAFTRDGRYVSCEDDGTALVWHVPREKVARLDADVASLWAALAGPAAEVPATIAALARAGDDAVAYLGQKLPAGCDDVRSMRAVEVLERVGTERAAALLRRLARHAGPRVADEVKAALSRFGR